jgi:hypothetical protein
VNEPRFLRQEEVQDELVDSVAREVQLRGMSTTMVLFLEASRPYRALGSQAMLFFDPVLRGILTGGITGVDRVMADDSGIERLIERLEELDEESRWDS